MDIQFIGQPIDEQVGERLAALLRDPQANAVRALVAWAKASGLRRVGGPLRSALAEGVDIEVVVGVDEGGATIEGLRALLDLTSRAFIFHNPGRPKRTFHPKVYIVECEDKTSVLIGSGNLTSGGLYSNYEADVLIEVSADERNDSDSPGARLLADVGRYYEKIREDPQSSRRLNEELIHAMSESVELRLGMERRRSSASAGTSSQATDPATPFDASQQPLLNAPTPTFDIPSLELPEEDDPEGDDSWAVTEVEAEVVEAESEAEAAGLGRTDLPGPAPERGAVDGPRFYKRLSKFDVSLTSSPGQIIIPIRFEDFFGELVQQFDTTNSQGGGQFERYMHGRFVDGSTVTPVEPRVILYIPGEHQPRPNREIRFTFHSRDVLLRLRQGDYLTFEWSGNELVVTRTAVSPGRGNFDWL